MVTTSSGLTSASAVALEEEQPSPCIPSPSTMFMDCPKGAEKPHNFHLQVIKRLCDPLVGRTLVETVISGLLKRFLPDLPESRAADFEIPGNTVTEMIKSLQKPWCLTHTDISLVLHFCRKEALSDHLVRARSLSECLTDRDDEGSDTSSAAATDKPSTKQPSLRRAATSTSTGPGPDGCDSQPPMTICCLHRALPRGLQRLKARYALSGHETMQQATRKLGKRRSFLSKSSGKLAERYDIKTELGSGNFGVVNLCVHHLSGDLRAVKSLPKDAMDASTEIDEVSREYEVLARLDHPNIVRVFEIFEDDRAVYIVMEPVLGGTLKDAMKKLFSDEESKLQKAESYFVQAYIAEVTRQLLTAVQYSHKAGIVHKDLKPANVMMFATPAEQPPRVVVCDFGVAELLDLSSAGLVKAKQISGTPSYMAPETFLGSYGLKVDLWSLGVILYELLTGGQLPFKANNMLLLSHLVCNKEPENLASITSEAGRNLCERLLHKSPEHRPSAGEALSEFGPWLTGKLFPNGPWWSACDERLKRQASKLAEGLSSLQQRSHFEQTVMACVASQLNMAELGALTNVFEKFDSNGNGVLELDELSQALAEMGLAPPDIAVIARELDKDQNGSVSYIEFAAGCLDLRRDQVLSQLRVAFSIFDVDGSGFLDREELRVALLSHGASGGMCESTSRPRTPCKSPGSASLASLPATPGATPSHPSSDSAARKARGVSFDESVAAVHRRANPKDKTGRTDCSSSDEEADDYAELQDLLPDGLTLDELLEELDSSGDGRVSFEEFCAYLLNGSLGEKKA